MKEIKKTVTIEQISGYEANDGTVFKTKEECQKYEETALCAINEAFSSVMGLKEYSVDDLRYLSCEDAVYMIDVDNAEILKIINMKMMQLNEHAVPTNVIGQTIVFIRNEYDGSWWFVGTFDDFRKRYTYELDNMFKLHKEEMAKRKGVNVNDKDN